MTHPLVTQLRFARSEFVGCLEGVSEADAQKRLEPMNCISWIVGHLAAQENGYWNLIAQGRGLYPDLHQQVGYGSPPSTPSLNAMWSAWREITATADLYLNTLSDDVLVSHLKWNTMPRPESVGTMLLRNTYHYWFHTGEAHAIRQQLGDGELPQFVGDMSAAVYAYGF